MRKEIGGVKVEVGATGDERAEGQVSAKSAEARIELTTRSTRMD